MNVSGADIVTIGLLVVLEGLLSADNALVVAIMILGLPRRQQKQALRYGLVGAFAFRIVATLLAIYLIRLVFVKLLGGLYLLWLAYSHFFRSGNARERGKPRAATSWLGMAPLWGTIVKVELVNIAFSVDSILVAVAISKKTWVVLTGGLLGIVMMRLVISKLLSLVRRYPTLVDAAFIIIAWVAIKLLVEYLNGAGYIDWHINKWLSIGLIVAIFGVAYVYARKKGPVDEGDEDEAASLLEKG